MPHLQPGGSGPSNWRRNLASRAVGPPLHLPGPGGSGPRAAVSSPSTPEAPVVRLSLCSCWHQNSQLCDLKLLNFSVPHFPICMAAAEAQWSPRYHCCWALAHGCHRKEPFFNVCIFPWVWERAGVFSNSPVSSLAFPGPDVPLILCLIGIYVHRQIDPFILVTLWMTIQI